MQLLHHATDEISEDACAAEVLNCVPTLMQHIRVMAQPRRAKSLSVQQFRALGIVRHRGEMSLSELAEQLGTAVASTSRLVGGLVRRGFLSRTPIPENRRQVRLALRAGGDAILAQTINHTRHLLAERLSVLTAKERATVVSAMRRLGQLFELEPAGSSDVKPRKRSRRVSRR